MVSKDQAVTLTLMEVARAHGKLYCYPSQTWILHLVKRHWDQSFCRRTLNRVLRRLEDRGVIVRVRRLRRGVCGRLVRASTLYKFTSETFKALKSLVKTLTRFRSVFHVTKEAHNKLPLSKVSHYASPKCGNPVENSAFR